MVQPQNIPRDEFPKSPSKSEGMIPIDIKQDNYEMRLIRDIEYVRRGDISLTIQLITLGWGFEKQPLIVYITGSAFRWQDIAGSIPRLCLLANRGFAVASVQYRGTEVAPFPAQTLDAKAAIRFLRKNADEYGIDADNIFVMGDSSGGHTALMTAFTEGVSELTEDIYGDVSGAVRGVIDYYGVTDITCMNDELSAYDHTTADCPAGQLIGGKNVPENPDLAKPTVVMNYITAERALPPALIFHGTNDEMVPFGQSCLLYDKLKQCAKAAEFYAVNGAHHGGAEFWSSRSLDIVERFVRSNMK